MRLTAAIEAYLHQRPVGHLFVAPFDVMLSNLDVVEPDLLYVSNQRSEILREWVHGAPDRVVEVLSPGTRKVDEITTFPCVAELTRDARDTLTTPFLPGVSMALDELFRNGT